MLSTSSLQNYDALSTLWRPIHISNYRFLGHKGIDRLYNFHESHCNNTTDHNDCVNELLTEMFFPISYCIPSKSETEIINHNMNKIFYSFITKRIKGGRCSVEKLIESNKSSFRFFLQVVN